MTMIKAWLAALIALLSTFATGLPIEEVNKLYPMTALVMELDEAQDLVYCEDYSGNIWVFSGVDDWCEGDLVSMMMYDNGTAEIEDDEILEIRYSGWIGHYGDD